MERLTRPYETLIRHHVDGRISAQHSEITEIVENGAIISASISAPVEIVDIEKLTGLLDAEIVATSVVEENPGILRRMSNYLFGE